MLAKNNQLWLLFICQRLEQLGYCQWLQIQIGWRLYQNATVCTNSHGSAQGFLALGHAAGNCHDFGDLACLFEARGFFHGDLVEGIHRHFDISDINTAVVGFDAYFDVVIYYPLDGD